MHNEIDIPECCMLDLDLEFDDDYLLENRLHHREAALLLGLPKLSSHNFEAEDLDFSDDRRASLVTLIK